MNLPSPRDCGSLSLSPSEGKRVPSLDSWSQYASKGRLVRQTNRAYEYKSPPLTCFSSRGREGDNSCASCLSDSGPEASDIDCYKGAISTLRRGILSSRPDC